MKCGPDRDSGSERGPICRLLCPWTCHLFPYTSDRPLRTSGRRRDRAGWPTSPAEDPGHVLTLQGHPQRDTQFGSWRPLPERSRLDLRHRPGPPAALHVSQAFVSVLLCSMWPPVPRHVNVPFLSMLILNCCLVLRGKQWPRVPQRGVRRPSVPAAK